MYKPIWNYGARLPLPIEELRSIKSRDASARALPEPAFREFSFGIIRVIARNPFHAAHLLREQGFRVDPFRLRECSPFVLMVRLLHQERCELRAMEEDPIQEGDCSAYCYRKSRERIRKAAKALGWDTYLKRVWFGVELARRASPRFADSSGLEWMLDEAFER